MRLVHTARRQELARKPMINSILTKRQFKSDPGHVDVMGNDRGFLDTCRAFSTGAAPACGPDLSLERLAAVVRPKARLSCSEPSCLCYAPAVNGEHCRLNDLAIVVGSMHDFCNGGRTGFFWAIWQAGLAEWVVWKASTDKIT